MSLDAFVYCDCYEKGKLRNPPPTNGVIQVEPDGLLICEHGKNDLEVDLVWDRWRWSLACEHNDGILLHHWLGNIRLIGLLRSELQQEPSQFPILLTKVLYSGSHAGDHLAFDEIPALKKELDVLANFRCKTNKADLFMQEFFTKMSELVVASFLVKKPIAF